MAGADAGLGCGGKKRSERQDHRHVSVSQMLLTKPRGAQTRHALHTQILQIDRRAVKTP